MRIPCGGRRVGLLHRAARGVMDLDVCVEANRDLVLSVPRPVEGLDLVDRRSDVARDKR